MLEYRDNAIYLPSGEFVAGIGGNADSIERARRGKLFAAAPDLLAAAQALVNVLSDDENDYADSQAYRQTMDQVACARAAIAKASGGAR